MTIINILRDGTVYPPLKQQDLVIKFAEGQISLGRFDKSRFISKTGSYLHEPYNAADLKADAIAYLTSAMPGLFGKQQVVHIICPYIISSKAEWISPPQWKQAFSS
ncbi:MAG: hypothetical protein JNM19_04050 [Chitinophagaceae bacterium]|nr:hypothetical protein [Chitinophagaceae bacterium]